METYNTFMKGIIDSDMSQFVDKFGVEGVLDVKNKMMSYLLNTKVFKVEEGVNELLLKTDNKIQVRKLPFDNFFIDVSISAKYWMGEEMLERTGSPDLPITGIWITKEAFGEPVVQLFMPRIWKKGNEDYDTMHNFTLFESKKHKLYDFIRVYVCNFLDFLNNPEVQTVTVERTEEQNKKRILRGKHPIPPQIFVNVNGKLKIYLNELQSGGHFNYSHRFWVRGHFRTLRNKVRYKDKVGTKIWIPPYIKGKGLLINKVYDVHRSAGLKKENIVSV